MEPSLPDECLTVPGRNHAQYVSDRAWSRETNGRGDVNRMPPQSFLSEAVSTILGIGTAAWHQIAPERRLCAKYVA